MRIFVLTGAGVSAESGLGTFRDLDGLWARFDPYKLATPQAFARDPDRVHAFYDMRRRDLLAARPNAAHVALARLQAALTDDGGSLFLCTQNIDDLHERGGATGVLHMHGELLRARCAACGSVSPWREALGDRPICPACGVAGRLRPHVVWFGEEPLGLDAIDAALRRSDLFVAIGTSGAIYPAAGLVREARALGVETCELNLEPSDNAAAFDQRRYGPASEIVPAWAAEIFDVIST